jgi:hypothetical protein
MDTPNIPVGQNASEPFKAKDDYYKSGKHRKVTDFMIGFFGAMTLWFLSPLIAWLFPVINISFISFVMSFIYVLSFVAFFLIAIYFSRKGRRFITIGMVSILIVPLLFLGSGCILLLSL